jgi:hypothetical protein
MAANISEAFHLPARNREGGRECVRVMCQSDWDGDSLLESARRWALIVIFFRRWVLESPRWFMAHGRNDEAEQICAGCLS